MQRREPTPTPPQTIIVPMPKADGGIEGSGG